MKKISPLLLGIMYLTGICSCSKHTNNEQHAPVTATIQFLSPAQGQQFAADETILISAHIQGSDLLHGYTVSIYKAGDTTTYFHEEVHDHQASIHTMHTWKDTIAEPAQLEAVITVTLDHEGNKESKKVGFSVL